MIKRGNKHAQEVMGMPFTVIFSIIIIIAVLVTAFYVINWFLDFQRCSQSAIFFNDLDEAVTSAYKSSFYDTGDNPFTRNLPSSIKKVCIADLENEGATQEEEKMLREFMRSDMDSNIFLYPGRDVCNEARSKYINYIVEKEGLYCFDVENGKVEIRIKRDDEGVHLLRQ